MSGGWVNLSEHGWVNSGERHRTSVPGLLGRGISEWFSAPPRLEEMYRNSSDSLLLGSERAGSVPTFVFRRLRHPKRNLSAEEFCAAELVLIGPL